MAQERSFLRSEFSSFDLYDTAVRGRTYAHGSWISNTNRHYTLRVYFPSGYPDECPSTYITWPSPLLGWRGLRSIESYGTNSSMHVWQTDRPGWTKVCTFRPESWSSHVSVNKVVRKGTLWIAAYECHLDDGSPISNFLVEG
ncbi:hypothetical protein [Streptomyces griseorubiginosus]|uniref:hypothetical protein n=1 Tax=Streptomyces griseorubiginosus TaxID=67304 RepID=UPI001AD7854B|nr:hypothetical protein [Streptomyces griseorubiginosus]MBO4258330.1 hypothetical protein [Streptomyces griseorubiginosus]